eukprot:tig00000025_g7928.t1
MALGGQTSLVIAPKLYSSQSTFRFELGAERLLQRTSNDIVGLLKSVGVRELSFPQYVQDFVREGIRGARADVVDRVMLSVLDYTPKLPAEERDAVWNMLAGFAFVPIVREGKTARATASELVNPNEELGGVRPQELLPGCTPSGGFAQEARLEALRCIGLRQHLSPSEVLRVAEEIAAAQSSATNDVIGAAARRARDLLQYANAASDPGRRSQGKDLLDLCAVSGKLGDLRWLPVCRPPPSYPSSIPWHGAGPSHIFAPPKQSHLPQDATALSATRPILDVNNYKRFAHIAPLFGWNASVPVELLASEVLACQGALQQTIATGGVDNAVRNALTIKMDDVYTRLRQRVGEESSRDSSFRALKTLLSNWDDGRVPWFWSGEAFLSSSNLATSNSRNILLEPNLHLITAEERRRLGPLVAALGVRDEFAPDVVLGSLRDWQKAYLEAPYELQSREVTSICNALALICESDLDTTGLLLPDSASRLLPPSELLIVDAWISDANKPQGRPTVHPTAAGQAFVRTLGVRKWSEVLVEGSRQLWLTPFAPKLDLINAIRNDVRDYIGADKDPLYTVIKEQLTNSDDRDATEVALVIDHNSYESQSLLSPGLQDVQVPSILWYQNKQFEKNDFEAIKQPHSGTKADNAESIGSFNRGFHVVYYLTDTPSFVSGSSLVIFDPHCERLPPTPSPAGLQVEPGIHLDFVGAELWRTFPDQLRPFCIEELGFDPRRPFDGTLIRLALRPAGSAAKSRISAEAPVIDIVKGQILAVVKKFESRLLLGLQSVRKFTVYERRPGQSSLAALFSLELELEDGPACSLAELRRYPDPAALQRHSDGLWRIGLVRATVRTGDGEAANSKSYQWLVVNHVPSEDERADLQGLRTETRRAIADWAGVFGALDVDSEAWRDDRGQFRGGIFSYLPMSGETGLPLHINAAFELASNRRDLLPARDPATQKPVMSARNAKLCQSILPRIYARFISELARLGRPHELCRHWPTSFEAKEEYQPLACETLRLLCEAPCIPAYPWPSLEAEASVEYLSPKDARFWRPRDVHGGALVDLGRREPSDEEAVAAVLRACGMQITTIPWSRFFYSEFEHAGVALAELTSEAVRRHLRDERHRGAAQAHLESASPAARWSLLRYALSDIDAGETATDEQRAQLDGCMLAFLQDGRAAVLELLEGGRPASGDWHYSVDPSLLPLFSEEQCGALLHSGIPKEELDKLTSAGLSARALDLPAFERLLASGRFSRFRNSDIDASDAASFAVLQGWPETETTWLDSMWSCAKMWWTVDDERARNGVIELDPTCVVEARPCTRDMLVRFFSQWPILRAQDGSLLRPPSAALLPDATCMMLREPAPPIAPEVKALLSRLSIKLADNLWLTRLGIDPACRDALELFVPAFSALSLLGAISAAAQRHPDARRSASPLATLFSSCGIAGALADQQLPLLLSYLSSDLVQHCFPRDRYTADAESVVAFEVAVGRLKSLPIFELAFQGGDPDGVARTAIDRGEYFIGPHLHVDLPLLPASARRFVRLPEIALRTVALDVGYTGDVVVPEVVAEKRTLAAWLGVRRLEAAAFVRDHVLPGFSAWHDGAKQAALLEILRLCAADAAGFAGVVGTLRGLRCIRTTNGSWLLPSEAINPSAPLLRMVFGNQDLFPADEFLAPPLDGVLQALGVLWAQDSHEGLLRCAREVERQWRSVAAAGGLQGEGAAEAATRSEAVLGALADTVRVGPLPAALLRELGDVRFVRPAVSAAAELNDVDARHVFRVVRACSLSELAHWDDRLLVFTSKPLWSPSPTLALRGDAMDALGVWRDARDRRPDPAPVVAHALRFFGDVAPEWVRRGGKPLFDVEQCLARIVAFFHRFQQGAARGAEEQAAAVACLQLRGLAMVPVRAAGPRGEARLARWGELVLEIVPSGAQDFLPVPQCIAREEYADLLVSLGVHLPDRLGADVRVTAESHVRGVQEGQLRALLDANAPGADPRAAFADLAFDVDGEKVPVRARQAGRRRLLGPTFFPAWLNK